MRAIDLISFIQALLDKFDLLNRGRLKFLLEIGGLFEDKLLLN